MNRLSIRVALCYVILVGLVIVGIICLSRFSVRYFWVGLCKLCLMKSRLWSMPIMLFVYLWFNMFCRISSYSVMKSVVLVLGGL